MTQRRLKELLEAFRRLRVLVLGDLMLDEYIFGRAERISPEAPIPVVVWQSQRVGAGGAGNVVSKGLSLGAKASVCGVVGDDQAGKDLACILKERGADVSGIVVDAERPTTVKTRVLAHHQQMLRIDREVKTKLCGDAAKRLHDAAARLAAEADAVIVSDYAKGVIMPEVTAGLQGCKAARLHAQLLLTAGPKPNNIECFSNFDYISLNTAEAFEYLRACPHPLPLSKWERGEGVRELLREVGEGLARQLCVKGLVITRGEEGASLFMANGWLCDVPAVRVQVYDVAGAGDTYLAALTLSLAAGASFEEAATLASYAAGAAVRKVGVAAVTAEEVEAMAKGV